MGAMTLQATYPKVPLIGLAGQVEAIDQAGAYITQPMKNAEASASIPFGVAVAYKTASPTSDLDAVLPAAGTAKLCGIVMWSADYARAWTASDGTVYGDLDSVGLRVGTILSVLRAGKILCVTQQAVKPGDPVFVCFSANTVFTAKGQLGNADESTNTINCTNQASWQTTAAIGGLSWVDADFRNK